MRSVFSRRSLLGVLALTGVLVWLSLAPAYRASDPIPGHLTDEEFWGMVAKTGFSEDCGSFRSENYLSNEISFQNVVAPLKAATKSGGVYMGVGPEQNFTYIVALQPKMTFIVDVRCGNMREHMMYKALFELSDNRVDFLSRLFSRKRPANLSNSASTSEMFSAFSRVQADQALFDKNVMEIEDVLVKTHKFGLSADDLDGIDTIYGVFFRYGPEVNYSATPYGSAGGGVGRVGSMPNYADLMTATDQQGKSEIGSNRSFLGSEENYKIIRDLEKKNLIVPLVGNFAGAKAIRNVGKYLKDHNAVVSAFYLSNVEQYLFTDQIADRFYNNVKTLPLDASSTFLRSGRPGGNGGGNGAGLVSMLSSIQDVLKAFDAGRVNVWNDVINLSEVP